MLDNRASKKIYCLLRQYKPGLTVVELLIVVVVIAILAALSWVGYMNLSHRAYDSAVKQDLQGLVKLINLYKAEKGVYPVLIDETTLQQYGKPAVAKNSYDPIGIHGSHGVYNGRFNMLYCSNRDSLDAFGLVAKSRSGRVFQATASASIQDFAGREPADSESLCGAVVPDPSVLNRSWFYTNMGWRPWING